MKIFRDNSLKHNFFIFLVITLCCYGYSCFERFEQFTTWKEMPAKYFSNETTMMTTLDSYYWLRLAKVSSSTQTKSERDQLRNFPDGTHFKLPLIAHMIAKAAPIFSNDFYLLYT